MSREINRPTAVSTSFGVRSVVLAPMSIVVAIVVGFLAAFTPIAMLAPNAWVGVSCGAGVLTGFAGIALGLICWVEGASSTQGASRRSAAIRLGVTGTILCAGAVLVLVCLWLYLPTQISHTPLGS